MFDTNTDSLLTVATICVAFYIYYMTYFNYWKNKNVPTPPPKFPAGNITKSILGQKSLFLTVKDCYDEFKAKGYKHAGLYYFNGPVYIPIDLEIIKSILTTDFEYFPERILPFDENKYPLTANLFTLNRSKWKPLRHKISPMFSSGKLKMLYNLFVQTTEDLKLIDDGDINIKDTISRFTTDIITATVLSVKEQENEYLSKVMHELFHPSAWMFFRYVVLGWFNRPEKIARGIQNNEAMVKYIVNLVEETIKQRNNNDVSHTDFLSFLLKIRDEAGLTHNEVLGTFFSFFVAGHDTGSNAITLCLFQLAYHEDIQERLRKEVLENLGSDIKNFNFEDLLQLKYLDKVFNETLRLHPPAAYYHRICAKSYRVSGTDVIIDKNTPVLIPILGLHHDSEYFPDPLKFDPERFENIETVIPGSYLPFGKGPRLCIGIRYATVQTKLTVAALVTKYKFFPSERTLRHIEYDRLTTTNSPLPEKGLWIKVKKLDS